MKKIFYLMLVAVAGISIYSCNNDEKTNNYDYNVRMTDAPGPYEKVNIDLQGVEITGKMGKMLC